MLALSRKIGQGVKLELCGVEVEIRLLRLGNGKARLGIIAPKEVGIIRSELLQIAVETPLAQTFIDEQKVIDEPVLPPSIQAFRKAHGRRSGKSLTEATERAERLPDGTEEALTETPSSGMM